MCVYEETYNNAIFKRDEANQEIERCKEAINYFQEWKKKTSACYDVIIQMRDQNEIIASYCNEIILNGKRIDEGERHYPNGNGETFSANLVFIDSFLYVLEEEIDKQIEKLNYSIKKSTEKKDAAIDTLRRTPKPPCGNCAECNPQAPVVTTKSETKTKTNNNKKTPKVPPSKKKQPFNSPYPTAL